jgi:hypothetical protein
MTNSLYYKNTGKIALASKISVQVRARMFAKFMATMQPDAEHRVLDIGVTSDNRNQEANYFERLYPHKEKIVCVGTEDNIYLEAEYPGLRFIKIAPHKPLPFDDNEFDIAFSNAVIEHVGSRESQNAFIKEMVRVSRSFFLTTPNRWFPVEFHTAIPFLHYLPPTIYRKILSMFGETFWSKEDNLNLISKNELNTLFLGTDGVRMDSVKLFGLPTNLIAYRNLTN